MRVISVDWDYFFSDGAPFDWSHNEEQAFCYEMIWHMRCSARNLMTREKAVDVFHPDQNLLNKFWDKVLVGKFHSTFITESHYDLYRILKRNRNIEIWNFDAHHDCGYAKKKAADCGNWAQKLGKKIKSFHQIYPAWRKDNPEPSPLRNPDTIQYEIPEPIKADVIFICRSSCWTPSWSDDRWLEFIKPMSEDCVSVPFVMKTRHPNLEEARNLATQYEEMTKNAVSAGHLQQVS